MLKRDETSETGLYIVGWCILAALLALGIFVRVTGIGISRILGGCAFHELTGLYCPGCGGTRAMRALFAGDIIRSFCYHPFVPFIAVTGTWFMVSQTVQRISRGKIPIGMHFRTVYLWIALWIIVLNVLVKNLALIFWHVDLLAI